MKLIEDHQRYVLQHGIALQHARQDPLGDHFESGMRTDAALTAQPEAHGFTRLLAKLLRQPLGHIARRQTTRFQHNNTPRQRRLLQQLQRQPGRFSCAGRGRQQHLGRTLQRRQQRRQYLADR